MSTYNYTTSQADSNRKIIYDMIVGSINVQAGWLAQLKRYGSREFTTAPGGKSFNFLIDSGAGGSAGAQSATGSVLHLGNQVGIREQVALPTSVMYARATCSYDDILQWQNAGATGSFMNLPMKNIQDSTTCFMQLVEAAHSADTGDGQLTTITNDDGSIAAGATGNITVAQKQQLPRGTVLTVKRAGNFLATTELYVRVSNGKGAGTVSVYNQGASAYDAEVGDILYIMESNNTLTFASLNESVSTIAYPPRGANTTAINNDDYKSIVLSGAGNQLTLGMFNQMWNQYKEKGFVVGDQIEDPDSGLKSFVNVCLMTYDHASALANEVYGKTEYFEPEQADAGWGRIMKVNGYPVVPNGMSPAEKIFILSCKGWICTFGDPVATTQGQLGVYRGLQGTSNYEAIFALPVAIACQNRRTQLKVNSVIGQTLASQGLSVSSD
jgi:hypothetical protein